MKPFLSFLLAIAPAMPLFADDITPAQPDSKKAAPAATAAASTAPQTSGLTFAVTAGVVSGPFVLTNGYLFQPEVRAELGEGGKAVFSFTITNDGEYVIHAVVNAPGEDSNSFFLNIDAQPEDPLTIWDVDPTNGFEERVVSWRGDGAADSDQFSPKRFKLTAGKHQLFLQGREPAPFGPAQATGERS